MWASACASAIETPSRAPASHCAQQCRSHAATPSGGPAANPSAARRYSAACRRCPTSGTARPFGSRPVATAVSRAAARATTPFGRSSNGASASSSPCTTATSTGAGTAVPPVTSSASSPSRCATAGSGRGRPSSAAVPLGRHQAGRGQHVQPGQRLQRRAAPGGRAAGPTPRRPAPPRPAPGCAPRRRARSGAPSSAADARAARRPASAAVAGQPRRFTGWLCTATSAARARATASATPGSSSSGASGSAGRAAVTRLDAASPIRADRHTCPDRRCEAAVRGH